MQVKPVETVQAPSLPKLRVRVRFSSPALVAAPGQRSGAGLLARGFRRRSVCRCTKIGHVEGTSSRWPWQAHRFPTPTDTPDLRFRSVSPIGYVCEPSACPSSSEGQVAFADATAPPIAQLLPSRQDFDEHATAEPGGPGHAAVGAPAGRRLSLGSWLAAPRSHRLRCLRARPGRGCRPIPHQVGRERWWARWSVSAGVCRTRAHLWCSVMWVAGPRRCLGSGAA